MRTVVLLAGSLASWAGAWPPNSRVAAQRTFRYGSKDFGHEEVSAGVPSGSWTGFMSGCNSAAQRAISRSASGRCLELTASSGHADEFGEVCCAVSDPPMGELSTVPWSFGCAAATSAGTGPTTLVDQRVLVVGLATDALGRQVIGGPVHCRGRSETAQPVGDTARDKPAGHVRQHPTAERAITPTFDRSSRKRGTAAVMPWSARSAEACTFAVVAVRGHDHDVAVREVA